ncbi:hypothetical protein [Staphylococcus kloosii]|uniref:hypothetical protein n=1 Tax=Staphylococcus kloosii TaxID=29384 RepID=UPI0028A4486D|nr:hypothetical protein [Staphylococcus kloosii]MDT3959516.1 hypothetical protein [Staphylococcus kloosii]
MSEPTRDDLLEFMKKHGPENVDSITDKDSAIKHFRTSSKVYKEQRDEYKAERDTLIDDVAILKANNERLMRRNQKLEAYVRMWDKLTKWKQGKLAERCNNNLLHELSYMINEIEREMYKGRDK